MIIPILYTATVMPFEIFFIEDTSVPGWLAADILITALFFLDMVVNVNIGYYDDMGFPVTSRKLILFNYLRTHFIVDIISLFPLGAWSPVVLLSKCVFAISRHSTRNDSRRP